MNKKSGAGSGKNWPAPQPCEKIKSIRKLYSSYSILGKIVSFYDKKIKIFYLFYIFLPFYLLVCGEKNILANLTNSQEPEPGVFGFLEPEPLEKKPGAGAAWEKNQEPEPEPLEKKVRSRSRSRKKIGRLPSPELK